ncbi:MAG: acyl-CoA/acyl-ACP dehydrogenase [Acidimicrobiales bacterium]|nr:acyl-CoA/acyl-ACP dehydrogenase [Acidimicrobiales bacterium]
MNFDFTEEQQAIAELSGQILGDLVTHERLKELERSGAPLFVADAWAELAKANLLGICLPESDGGSGLGFLEACIVLDQIGRTVAPLPYLATVVCGALPLAEFGTEHQRRRWLPGVITGETILSAGLAELGSGVAAVTPRPSTMAEAIGGGYRLHGEKAFVSYAQQAAALLVPARTEDDRTIVALVETTRPGVRIEPLLTTSGLPEGLVTLAGVEISPDEVLGGTAADGEEIVSWIADRATVGVCALQAGVCAAALKLTATYTSERHQFGVPIATFQAVAHRAADAYTDSNGVALTMWQAAWRLSAGLPAADEIDIAKFWAADGGQRMIHACQHLHGGIGVDTDYSLHRYFRWSKHLELTLGGASEHLRFLGARLASEPV